MLSEPDWAPDSISAIPDTSFLPRIINYCDESALELSCRFKASEKSHVTALTIGDKADESFGKTLLALGIDDAVILDTKDNPNLELSSEFCAEQISRYIKDNNNFDLIITGEMSGDHNQAKVPYLLSESLHLPCISKVLDLKPCDEKHIYVSFIRDKNIIHGKLTLPCVLSVSNSAKASLHVPTLLDRMKAKEKNVRIINTYSSHKKNSPALLGTKTIIQSRDPVQIDGSDAQKAVDRIMRYINEWKTT